MDDLYPHQDLRSLTAPNNLVKSRCYSHCTNEKIEAWEKLGGEKKKTFQRFPSELKRRTRAQVCLWQAAPLEIYTLPSPPHTCFLLAAWTQFSFLA